MYKIFESKYVFIVFLFCFFIVSLVIKKDEIYKNIGAPNIEAPYHVLHTVNAYIKNDISQHYFLPTVTLENELDKFIPWGATVPDAQGNYFYTSFTSTTFVLPYLYFKITGAELNIQNLVKFNYLLQFTSIILIFLLLRKINFIASQNNFLSNMASFLATVFIFIFSTEFLISFGLGYWAHSISQILIILQLCIFISIQQDGFNHRKLVLLGFVSIVFCYTEWTGFSITGLISLYFLYLYIRNKNKDNLKIFIALISSIIIGGLLIVAHYGFVIGFENLFNALYSRFSARSAGRIGSVLWLIIGYVKSYGLYLLIIPITYVILKNDNKNIEYKLYFFPILYALLLLMENIIMMQHAGQFSFDRLKVGVFLAILFNVLFLYVFVIKKNIYTKLIMGGVLISMIQNIYTYDYIIKKYASMEKIHNNNIGIRDFVNIDKKSILCANTNVRGYINFLFNRSIYENIENIEKCKTISKDKDIESVIFIHTERPFTDIHEILKIVVDNKNSNTTKTYPEDKTK